MSRLVLIISNPHRDTRRNLPARQRLGLALQCRSGSVSEAKEEALDRPDAHCSIISIIPSGATGINHLPLDLISSHCQLVSSPSLQVFNIDCACSARLTRLFGQRWNSNAIYPMMHRPAAIGLIMPTFDAFRRKRLLL